MPPKNAQNAQSAQRRVKKLPLSGSEPSCTRAPFSLKTTVPRNNCYSYAVQHLARTGTPRKLQPGNLSGLEGQDFNLQTCHPAFTRVLRDLVSTRRGYMAPIETPCRRGFGKIALMLSRGNDFHFIRQNGDVVYPVEAGETPASIARKFRVPLANVKPIGGSTKKVRIVNAGVWSHKRGTAFAPTLYDAKGNVIFDPRKANFNYGYLNYDRILSVCVASAFVWAIRSDTSGGDSGVQGPMVFVDDVASSGPQTTPAAAATITTPAPTTPAPEATETITMLYPQIALPPAPPPAPTFLIVPGASFPGITGLKLDAATQNIATTFPRLVVRAVPYGSPIAYEVRRDRVTILFDPFTNRVIGARIG